MHGQWGSAGVLRNLFDSPVARNDLSRCWLVHVSNQRISAVVSRQLGMPTSMPGDLTSQKDSSNNGDVDRPDASNGDLLGDHGYPCGKHQNRRADDLGDRS